MIHTCTATINGNQIEIIDFNNTLYVKGLQFRGKNRYQNAVIKLKTEDLSELSKVGSSEYIYMRKIRNLPPPKHPKIGRKIKVTYHGKVVDGIIVAKALGDADIKVTGLNFDTLRVPVECIKRDKCRLTYKQ